MTTDRGFVQSIDVGRGGLVTVTVLLGDGTTAVYVISDLDGDPERFNERLSKLALLRDAMNRAEPVEIDHDPGPAGEEIERAERITRDALGNPAAATTATGLVAGLLVHAQNVASAPPEQPDYAEVALLATSGTIATYRVNLQIPERTVAEAQLEVVRTAFDSGSLVQFLVTAPDAQGEQWVLEVATGSQVSSSSGGAQVTDVSGFVESLSLIAADLPSGFGASSLASVGFTTAPELTGVGGTVDPAPFSPQLLELVVVEGTLTYVLLKSGLQENLRMRVATTPLAPATGSDNPPPTGVAGQAPTDVANNATIQPTEGALLVTGAELLAPLASASRPVWVRIDRSLLDRGPDADCVPGVPINDLTPRTLRDLGIPYNALWRGLGCFNRGVYRFQVGLPGAIKIWLDERRLCLYPAECDDESAGVERASVQFAYACVEGDHEVRVEIEGWTCGSEFPFDVYRIR